MKQKVFLDSSVLFTAVNSPTGGSAKLFTIQTVGFLVSTFVLTEVERNIRKKLLTPYLNRFFMLTKLCAVSTYIPSHRQIEEAEKVITAKDAIILAGAKHEHISSLLTLDQKHFLTEQVKTFLSPKRIYTPKEFLETMQQ